MESRDSVLENFRKGVLSESEEATYGYAKALAEVSPESLTLALHGDLGTGKTTFVRGLAKAWEIKGPITSPSYNLFNIHQGTRMLCHVDAYRLDETQNPEDLMIEDFLKAPYCLAIEWPDHIPSLVRPDAWHLYFSIENGKHRIQLKAGTPSG